MAAPDDPPAPAPQPQPVPPQHPAPPPQHPAPPPQHPKAPPPPPPQPLYAAIPGIRWVPLYDGNGTDPKGPADRAKLWMRIGTIGAGVVAAAVVLLAILLGDSDNLGTVIGVGGAVAVGLLMICVGIGLLTGEALRAERVVARPPTPQVTAEAFTGDDLTKYATVLQEGLRGLTAARALVFAGALLLSIAALAGGISTAGSDGDGDGNGDGTSTEAPATTPAPSGAPAPTS